MGSEQVLQRVRVRVRGLDWVQVQVRGLGPAQGQVCQLVWKAWRTTRCCSNCVR